MRQKLADFTQPLFLVAALIASNGCSNDMAEIPDTELADSMYECRQTVDHSPGGAIRCDNIARECERRRNEGRYVC